MLDERLVKMLMDIQGSRTLPQAAQDMIIIGLKKTERDSKKRPK